MKNQRFVLALGATAAIATVVAGCQQVKDAKDKATNAVNSATSVISSVVSPDTNIADIKDNDWMPKVPGTVVPSTSVTDSSGTAVEIDINDQSTPAAKDIFTEYAKSGYANGDLGVPLIKAGDESKVVTDGKLHPLAIPGGAFLTFYNSKTNQSSDIYFKTGDSQAYVVYGAIAAEWDKNHRETGSWGWPQGEETPGENGVITQKFSNGTATFTPAADGKAATVEFKANA